MALITQAEAREALPELTSDDPRVAAMIVSADAILAGWCGYPTRGVLPPTFLPVDYVFRALTPDGEELKLPVYPIVRIDEVDEEPDETDEAEGILYRSDRWPSTVRVEAVCGFGVVEDGEVVTQIPDDIKRAATLYVRHLWDLRKIQGRQSTSQQGGSVSHRAETIPDPVRQILGPRVLWRNRWGL